MVGPLSQLRTGRGLRRLLVLVVERRRRVTLDLAFPAEDEAMTDLTESIPPVFTEWIGAQLLRTLESAA